MKFYAARGGGIDAQNVRQVPGYGFALAIRVGREVNGLGSLGFLADAREDLSAPANGDVFGLEIVIYVYADLRFGQIANVPLRVM